MTKRVLVTRSAEDAPSLIAALEALGLHAPHLPLTQTVLLKESTARLRRALVTAEVVLLTSKTAAEAVARVWREPVRTPRFAVVGPATAKRAADLGLPVDVVPSTATGRDLVEALGTLRDVRLLYPRAEVVTSATTEALHRAGADLTEIIAYRNAEPTDVSGALTAVGQVDLVTLFSGSAARRYARGCRRAGLVPAPAAVIGPSTEQTALSHDLLVAGVASPHTEDGVLDVVCSILAVPRRRGV